MLVYIYIGIYIDIGIVYLIPVFCRKFSRNFEIPEVSKIRFSACSHRDNERKENLLSDDEKIPGRDVCQNKVKNHFEDFYLFLGQK